MIGFTTPRIYHCPRTGMWWTAWKGLNRGTLEFTHEYVVMQTSPPLMVLEQDGQRWRERG